MILHASELATELFDEVQNPRCTFAISIATAKLPAWSCAWYYAIKNGVCNKAVCNSATEQSNTITSNVHCMSPRLHSAFLLSLISYKYVCVLVSKEICCGNLWQSNKVFCKRAIYNGGPTETPLHPPKHGQLTTVEGTGVERRTVATD